ncbi:Isoflavone reductase, putative [Ricinus communis]|uniref:Isoflavone reductase, putative n=1 Tax=Ricinus communis TaxID=3988 RepID=B9RH60_RICCO|nr:Isoflavone reductase, putative [Ricinus communis]
MADKSKILFIGGTGYIGKFIVEASAKAGHPTFALLRDSTLSNPHRFSIITTFKNLGVQFLIVSHALLPDQVKIIAAIKEAGNVKRFFPSEFGNDVDRVHPVEPAKTSYDTKVKIRRAVEGEGIPYTYVSCNFFAGYFLYNLAQPEITAPPRDKVVILGDGNAKAIFNEENDIGTYTIRAVDDPRTLNKTLYISPPQNIISFNDLVSLWEKKMGKTLERKYIPEEQVLKNTPGNVMLALEHAVFVKGGQTNFEIEPSLGVEASELYPNVKYTSVDEYLNQFV